MSHFEHSTKLGYAGLVLSDNDVKVLLPIVRRALRIEQNAVDRYKDILDGGDATERQQTCLMKHMEQESALQVIFDEMKTIIKAK
jgi:hypothetical protein